MKTSRIATWGLLSMVLVAKVSAQTPPYLREMPSVERVMSEVRGSDPKQTALLQIETFNELEQIVKAMAGPREFNLTPEEGKWVQTYRLAASHAAQDADKAFPGPYGKWKRFSLNVPYYPRDYYLFGVDTQVFKRFFSPSFRAEFEKAIGADQARHEAFVRAQEQADAQAKARANAGGGDAIANANAVALGNVFSGNSPDTVAARRCLELGHSPMECTTKGFIGMIGMLGANFGQSRMKPGLSMSGIYKSKDGLALDFDSESVSIAGCGKLVGDGHAYALRRKGGHIVFEVSSAPQSFTLALGPDGNLSGPGMIAMDGQIVVGHTTVYIPASSDPAPYGTPGHSKEVDVYAPKTERCVIGSFIPTGSSFTVASAYQSAIGVFSGQSSDQASRSAAKVAPPPGLRIGGQYAGPSGIKVTFEIDDAILDCGEAHVARPYTVHSTANQVVVTVQNGPAPLTLELQPDGSLNGSGTVDVVGRVMTGMAAGGPAFAPRSARCAVGTLSAQ